MENARSLNLRLGHKLVSIQLEDSAAARDLRALLPLTLVFNDLLGREKFAHLPEALSSEDARITRYGRGDIVFWPPGPDISIYYGPNDRFISAGVFRLGRVVSGLDDLARVGPLHALIEATD
jgi:hypothetical protein